MQLTRVTAKAAQHPSATAKTGETDLLALLLAGDQNAAGSGFPAALDAVSDGETAVDPLAVGHAPTKDGDKKKAGDGTNVVDAAIAAALGLAGATPGAAQAHVAVAAAGTAAAGTAIAGKGIAAAESAATGKASGAAAGAAATLTASSGTATGANAASSVKATADAAVGASATAASVAKDATTAEPRPVPTAPAADQAAKSDALETVATTTVSATSAAATTSTATQELATTHGGAHGDAAAPTHGAGAGVDTTQLPAFSSGGGHEHGLDLASSERDQAAALVVEKTVHAPASSTATVTASAALPQDRPAPDTTAATNGAPPVTATSNASTAHEPVRLDKTVHEAADVAPRWSERVVDAVRLSALRGGGEIRLQLEPEGLGHIDVRLHLQSDGVHAVIVAEHESTRALLTSQQHVLQDAFTRSDLRLSGFSVDVGAGSGGAASFARPDDGNQPDAPAATPETPASASSGAADDGATAGAALANGRVSVRV